MDYLLNTNSELAKKYNYDRVLNLIINGLPSKLKDGEFQVVAVGLVLNLIINGLPSKLSFSWFSSSSYSISFKPYYKWITF